MRCGSSGSRAVDEMSGTIGVITDYAARYVWFYQCLTGLNVPPETTVRWSSGANRGAMRNALARECLDNGDDWIFFVDDDQAFPVETLIRLLAHGQPVVSALIFQRAAPFLPTAYATKEHNAYQPLDIRSVGNNNLVKVAGAGTGGLLIRSEVLRKLDDGTPWFVYTDEFGEDLYFCNRLAEAGIDILVDTACRMGHIAPSAVFPSWDKKAGWTAQFKWGVDGTSTERPLEY